MTTITTVQISEGIRLEIHSNGIQQWYKNGKLHRDNDQPAIICPDGSKCWRKEGKRHREGDQPASIWANGMKEWYKDDTLHRDSDQPAVIQADGTKYWYKDGIQYTPQVKVEEKKSQDETVLEENKRLKEEVARLQKIIITIK